MPIDPDSSTAPKKRVIAIRQDLTPRLIEKARELEQNPNHLVNLLTEGGLNAMDAESAYESPIVQLYRSSHGKTLMTSNAAMTLCSMIIPEIHEIDRQELRILFELINKHEGPLTPNIFKGYRQVAVQMNEERLEHERQLAELQQTPNSR